MTVAMKIDGLTVLLVPASKRVVAQDQVRTVHHEFGIMLHTCPAVILNRGRLVVVADDEMFPAVQALQQEWNIRWFPCEITQMPNLVRLADHGVPSGDKRFIHGLDAAERTLVDVERAMIAEVRVTGEEQHRI